MKFWNKQNLLDVECAEIVHICITCHKFPNSSPLEILLKVIIDSEEVIDGLAFKSVYLV